MNDLPDNVISYKKTPIFTHETLPESMLNSHQTKKGVWGLLHVLEGKLTYCIDNDAVEKHCIEEGSKAVITPEEKHHLEIQGSVQCYIEFFK